MPSPSPNQVDTTVIIVGAGFSGIASLYRSRKLGLDAKILEAGDNYGGVWYWNRYPGARVDSEWPFYQLDIPEVYETFAFTQRFPDHAEIRRYMAHADAVLGLRKDTLFGARVVDAHFDEAALRWTVRTAGDGVVVTGRYLVLASGLLHKPYVPAFPGIRDFRGPVHHSAEWPESLSCRDKRVAVVGSGATAVQVVQEVVQETADKGAVTVLMRRPSTCMPLQQKTLSAEEQKNLAGYFTALFAAGLRSHSGFPVDTVDKTVAQTTAAEREALFEKLWQRGGFHLNLAGYSDAPVDAAANRAVYDFWARKVRARMTDPVKRDIMAPLTPLYPFNSKRTPLENGYYEALDQKHVELVPLGQNPIDRFVADGVVLRDGTHRALDIIILATGFDSYQGSLTSMGLKNRHGVDLKDIWRDGIRTHLGLCMHGFPNCFIIYSPQAPTAFTNGPSIIDGQADLVFEAISRLEQDSRRRGDGSATIIEATAEAEDDWAAATERSLQGLLVGGTDSWWNGGNIPGRKKQALIYGLGLGDYLAVCREKMAKWEGFAVTRSGDQGRVAAHL